MKISVELNDTTAELLKEHAESSGISIEDVVSVIISEWAIRKLTIHATLKDNG